MEKFIRQLTHDNGQFEAQWPNIFDRIHKMFDTDDKENVHATNNKVEILNAVVDYALAESTNDKERAYAKEAFIEQTIKIIAKDPIPPLTDIVCAFRRILDSSNIFTQWHLVCIQAFHYKFILFRHLSETKSVDLIESIFQSLQKHSFLKDSVDENTNEQWTEYLSRRMFSQSSTDTSALNCENVMVVMRSAYQQLFRHAVRLSHQSDVWSHVVSTWTRTLPTLFDEYANPDDALSDLVECVKQPISIYFIDVLAKSHENNVELFKTTSAQIPTVIEHLLLANQIEGAHSFLCNVVLKHYESATDILEPLIRIFIRICPQVNIDNRYALCERVLSSFVYKLANVRCNKKLATLLFDLAIVILNLCVKEAPKYALNLLQKTDFYPWKELAPKFKDLIESCIAYEKMMVTDYFSGLDSLEDILRLVVERAKVTTTIFRATHDDALQATIRWSATASEHINKKMWWVHVYKMGRPLMELIDQKQLNDNILSKFIKALEQRIIDVENDDDQETTSLIAVAFFLTMTSQLATYIEVLKNLPHDIHQQLASLMLTAVKRPHQTETGQMSFEHTMTMILWHRIAPCLKSEVDVRFYDSCLKYIHSLAYEDEKDCFDWWNTFWIIVGMKLPDVAADYIEDFLNDLLDHHQINTISLLPTLYPKRPDPFHSRLNDLIKVMCSSDVSYISSFAHLFWTIVKEHPELITEDQVNYLFTSCKSHTGTSQELYMIFQGLSFVANAQPYIFYQHRDTLVYFIVEQQNIAAFTCLQQYLVASSIVDGDKRAEESLALLIDLLKRPSGITSDIKKQIFYACQLIGIVNKRALENKRTDLEVFSSYPECRNLIDFIDGNKMTEENQATINQTREEITRMEKRVVKTEKGVNDITKIVQRQELKILLQQQAYSALTSQMTRSENNNTHNTNAAISWIDRIELSLDSIFLEMQTVTNLGERIDSVDTRLTDISEQVQVQAREIERIDAKTLSYVPAEWGRQVTKLLNLRADNDWRLLGKRFGYSTSELRHWALQADPTMSLLNEWFMTHKPDEATYGLVKMLDEIGRQDVTKIIRDALAEVGQLIPDEMPFEIKRLPPVFLSYQWGSQKAVTTLRTHLEQAGYLCWMDIGQMGGGDKLFAKIDAGIRGAKVIICCINSAYSQSDNCLREVHLSISTGKPIIPLQMEKQTWPPEGALGPIMSEYLYIRFYDRKSNSPDYWPADRFTELLAQIRYHVAPDPGMISGPYINWFVPRVDNLIFLQPTPTNKDQNKQVNLQDDTPLVVTHPQVMISYQWDRQTDIVALYKRLTQLGYRCWLDIFQMGGGDSLFEKIDNGIRNAKCILACVTPKYTKSINCRREMSLADALNKTIVPLLLEDTTTWPPPGPMSLVFTEKEFLDFRHSNEDAQKNFDIWSLKDFDKVLARLKITVPEVQTEKPRKHLLDMKRPTTASSRKEEKKKPTRIRSAPIVPQSRACLLM